MYLERAIFVNRAPFDKLDINFLENEIAVISAVNGRGKTTLLSHLADAFYEMARPNFQNEFEGKENKFYRVSSVLHNRDFAQPSFVYFRFGTSDGVLGYVDIRNSCTDVQYNDAIPLPDKIPFHELQASLNDIGYIKKLSSNFDKKRAEKTFAENLLTYFPSYRFELPGYLNDPYKVSLDFKKQSGFAGYLKNPIEVVTGLPQLANWIMDVVLDLRLSSTHGNSALLFENLSSILSAALHTKNFGKVGFGVGSRGLGGTRIQIMEQGANGQAVYPTIFNLSSGESSLFCLFGELLRQADNNKNNILLNEVTGIVLIDEVDKHLHIKLQKEVLPILFNMFPKVQFIVSSHSPFLSMGLAAEAPDRSRIIDLDTLGISRDPASNDLYVEVYNMMLGESGKFKTMFQALEQKIRENSIPLVITEGKTDVQHIRQAKSKLSINDCEFEFYEIGDNWGDSKLKPLLEQLSKVMQQRRIIGIFDRDVPSVVSDIEKDGRTIRNYGNNVFAFCIPVPEGREIGCPLSLEFYYSDRELKKEKDGRCLYFDNEVAVVLPASNRRDKTILKLEIPRMEEENTKKVFDEDIGGTGWIHSKARFAELVETDEAFIQDFDFSNFNLVFEKIREILRT
jgi:predicted ATPase